MNETRESNPAEPVDKQATLTSLLTLREVSLLPIDSSNPFLHFLVAAISGLLSAVPVVALVWVFGAEYSGGAVVLFAAFLAVLIQHTLSRFAFPALTEQGMPHGVATMLLIGQVLGAYLFFLHTAFYGATAIATAVLIAVPLFGRLCMVCIKKQGFALCWAYIFVVFYAIFFMFNLFDQHALVMPLQTFLKNCSFGIENFVFALLLIGMPGLCLLLLILSISRTFRRFKDQKSAAATACMLAEVIAWFAFLVVIQKFSFLI